MPYYGFNFLWMYVSDGEMPKAPDERALDFVAQTGFNFVRVPTNYRSWIKDFDYLHPDEAVFTHLDRYLDACRQRGLHLSLNLHRAPGYCINRNDLERDNLWTDAGGPGRVRLSVGNLGAALQRHPRQRPLIRPPERAAERRPVRSDPRKPRRS